MDSPNTAKWIVVLLTALNSCVFADTIHIYTGQFELPITDKSWMPEAIIEIPDHLFIQDLDVGITITHTNVFDLQIFLQSPGGTQLCLNMYNIDEFFIGANYTSTIFDDEAIIAVEDAQPPFTGRFKPKAGSFLQAFDNQDIFGTWQLRVYDAFLSDTGTLDKFELTVTTPEPSTAFVFTIGTVLLVLFRDKLKLIKAIILGFKESNSDLNTNFSKPLIEFYDIGRLIGKVIK